MHWPAVDAMCWVWEPSCGDELLSCYVSIAGCCTSAQVSSRRTRWQACTACSLSPGYARTVDIYVLSTLQQSLYKWYIHPEVCVCVVCLSCCYCWPAAEPCAAFSAFAWPTCHGLHACCAYIGWLLGALQAVRGACAAWSFWSDRSWLGHSFISSAPAHFLYLSTGAVCLSLSWLGTP